jgi:peptide deformylase
MYNKSFTISKDGDPVLRKVAIPVLIKDIQTGKIKSITDKMSNALAIENKYGVAIAAPQIGISFRIFIVAGRVFGDKKKDAIFINPFILKRSKKMQQSHESCLSIQGRPVERGPDMAGIVKRPAQVTIEYYDENAVKHTRGAGKLLAAIFDHEIDHLDGILFIDKTIDKWAIDKDFNRID